MLMGSPHGQWLVEGACTRARVRLACWSSERRRWRNRLPSANAGRPACCIHARLPSQDGRTAGREQGRATPPGSAQWMAAAPTRSSIYYHHLLLTSCCSPSIRRVVWVWVWAPLRHSATAYTPTYSGLMDRMIIYIYILVSTPSVLSTGSMRINFFEFD